MHTVQADELELQRLLTFFIKILYKVITCVQTSHCYLTLQLLPKIWPALFVDCLSMLTHATLEFIAVR